MDMMAQMPDHQKAELMRHMEESQVGDSLRTYNRVVKQCFDECVKSFRSKKLEDKEETCINNCTQKFLKHSQRVGQRFAEAQSMNAGAPQ